MKKILAVIALFTSTLVNAAPDCTLPSIKGMSYHKARAFMIEKGYAPHNYQRNDELSIVVTTWYRLGYDEVADCSGTGHGLCWFSWQDKKGKALTVTTWGEDSPPSNFATVKTVGCGFDPTR